MNAPVLTRRHLVAGGAAAIGVASLSAGIIETVTSPAVPANFDPAAFVADLGAAGCEVVLMGPGTVFKPGDEVSTYFIRPAPGYTGVMTRWCEALEACPDSHERVVARLVELNGWAS